MREAGCLSGLLIHISHDYTKMFTVFCIPYFKLYCILHVSSNTLKPCKAGIASYGFMLKLQHL